MSRLWAYAYKIDYVNYICPLIVEKLILSTPPLSNRQLISWLGAAREKSL